MEMCYPSERVPTLAKGTLDTSAPPWLLLLPCLLLGVINLSDDLASTSSSISSSKPLWAS